MGFFDFLFGKKNEIVIRFYKESYLIISDVIVGDKIKLWKPENSNLISFFDKEINERIGRFESKKLVKILDDKVEYISYVSKISNNWFFVKVVIKDDNNNISNIEIPLSDDFQKLNNERFERINKRNEEDRRIAAEKRALVQPQYDKVLNIHQKKLKEFTEKYESLKGSTNNEKLLVAIEKELTKIETKIDKRGDFFCGKSEKWQESEKGELYEDITNELSDIEYDLAELRDDIIKLLAK